MPREWAEPRLRRMVQSLCHEPFYESGTWIDASLGIAGRERRVGIPVDVVAQLGRVVGALHEVPSGARRGGVGAGLLRTVGNIALKRAQPRRSLPAMTMGRP